MSLPNTSLLSYSDTLLRLRYNAGKYGAGNGVEIEYPAVDELRPLSLLNADLPALFPYTGKYYSSSSFQTSILKVPQIDSTISVYNTT